MSARVLIVVAFLLATVANGLNLFGGAKRTASKPAAAARSQVSTEAIQEVQAKFAKNLNNPLPPLRDLQAKFDILSSGLGGAEEKAATVCKLYPFVLYVDNSRLTENLRQLNEAWGPEKTSEVLLRNPNILSTAPQGYGSIAASLAKGNGNDIVGASYLIAATRPAGPVLLALLFAALAKAAIFGVN
jgi:hypothetical protein